MLINANAYFITGTDTNAGKTFATITLMHYFQQQGKTVIAIKPVAAGCSWVDGQLKNTDALLFQQYNSIPLPYSDINPYAYELPVSPHIAGTHHPVSLLHVVSRFEKLKQQADIILIEGAGGWYSPVNTHEANNDLATVLAVPVILVVAMRLGCINQARLSYLALCADNVPCAGWLAVCVDPDMDCLEENIGYIAERLTKPLLGILPYMTVADFGQLAGQLRL